MAVGRESRCTASLRLIGKPGRSSLSDEPVAPRWPARPHNGVAFVVAGEMSVSKIWMADVTLGLSPALCRERNPDRLPP